MHYDEHEGDTVDCGRSWFIESTERGVYAYAFKYSCCSSTSEKGKGAIGTVIEVSLKEMTTNLIFP